MAKFRVDVDGKDVARRLQDRIEDGVDNAADEINDQMRQVAKGKIRDENAVFTRELLEGFTDAKTTFGRSTVASLRNLSFHAPYQEKGVSGTQKQRNTPYKYKDKKPPIDALIPWILTNLYGAYWPEDALGPPPSGYYGSDVSNASRSSGTSGSGGYESYGPEILNDPLMGADELDVGTSVGVKIPDRGFKKGTIRSKLEKSINDYKFRADDGGIWYIKAEEIESWPDKGIDPADLEVGLDVYIGGSNSSGTVTDIYEDPDTGEITGAGIDFTGDGIQDDLLDLSQFEKLITDRIFENGVPIDQNRLYLGEDGYSVQNINEEFDVPDLFPNQQIVVFNTNEKEYLRGTVREFGEDDLKIKFELEEVDGALFDISSDQQSEWRLAGTENWDDLIESEQKDRLAQFFDDYVATGYTDLNQQQLIDKNLKRPGSTAVSSARDFWTGNDMFSIYKDNSIIREQVRNLEAIVSFEDSYISQSENKNIGGAITKLTANKRFLGIFLSDSQFRKYSNWDLDDRELILAHEAKHALSSILELGTYPKKNDYFYSDILNHSDWTSSGLNNVARPDVPGHIDELLFRDTDGKVLGGLGWIKDAYYAADNGRDGIRNYSPTFETGKDEPYKRLHEAANHALWIQQVSKGNFVRNGYSSFNAAETLATLEEQMWGSYQEWEDNLERLVNLYPWLVEAWLEGHNPPQKVEDKLESLGWNL